MVVRTDAILAFIVLSVLVHSFQATLLLGPCKSTEECPAESTCTIRGCDGSLCLCKRGNMPDGKYTKCLKIAELGDSCNNVTRCRGLSSRCNSTHCVCQNGYMRSGKYCKPQPLFSTSFALYGESCNGERIKCPELYNLQCYKGRCICKTGFERADADVMNAYPFNVIQCVPKAFRIGVSINASDCFYPASESLIGGASSVVMIDSSSAMLLPSETPNILSSEWKSTHTPLLSLSPSVLQTSSSGSLESLINFRTSESIMPSVDMRTTMVTSIPLSGTGSSLLSTVIDSSGIDLSELSSTLRSTITSSKIKLSTSQKESVFTTTHPSLSTAQSSSANIQTTQANVDNSPFLPSSTFKTSLHLTSSTLTSAGNSLIHSIHPSKSTMDLSTVAAPHSVPHGQVSQSPSVIDSHTTITSSGILITKSSRDVTSHMTSTSVEILQSTKIHVSDITASRSSEYPIESSTIQSTVEVTPSSQNPTGVSMTTGDHLGTTRATTPFVFPVGQPCYRVSPCVSHSDCEMDSCGSYRCRCQRGYIADTNKGVCLRLSRLGEACDRTLQCIGPNTVCRHGKCTCDRAHTVSSGGCRCRRVQSWFVKFPLLGDKCSNFFSECYNDYEQNCIAGVCRCKPGLRKMEDADMVVHYTTYRQCINESIPAGFRSPDLCEGQSMQTETDPSVSEANRKIRIMIGSIIGGSIAFVCLVIGIIGVIFCIRHKRRSMKRDMQSDTSSDYSFDRRSSGKFSFRVPRPFITGTRDWPTDDVSFHNTTFEGDETDRLREDENKSYNGTIAKAFNFGDTDYKLHEEGK